MNYLEEAFKDKDNLSILGVKISIIELVAKHVLSLGIPGDVVECGVYKGGSARLLSTIFKEKKIFLFDSFHGMEEDDKTEDGFHRMGDFGDTSLEEVRRYLSDKSNCMFFPGWIPESTNFLKNESFCFAHLDLDLYQSTKSAIEIFWPRISLGGVLVVDDWEWKHCPGVKKAVIEYFGEDLSRYGFQSHLGVCLLCKQ
jgi:O-methyltransferase